MMINRLQMAPLACLLMLLTIPSLLLLAPAVCGAHHEHMSTSITEQLFHSSARNVLSAPMTSAVLDSSVVQPGPAVEARLEDYSKLLPTFKLQDSDLNVAFLPPRVYPIERGTCGAWMQPYSQLHRDILQGRKPPRYSIFKQGMNGLTDRLVSSVSVFLHALLTDRAFLFDWSGQHSLWYAYRSSYIDWRYDRNNPPEKDAPPGDVLLLDFMGKQRQGDYRSPEHALFYKWFTQTQLEDIGRNATYLIWTVNRGLVWKAAFSNIYIKQRLWNLGLNPINIFGCLFDYLYRPTPSAMNLVAPLLPQLLDPTIFKVGVQIRTGDDHLVRGKNSKQFEDAFEWFHCAKVAEETWKPPAQKSLWFLLTDSPDIRRGARNYLGDKLVTMKDALVAHTLYISSEANNRSNDVLGFAAAEAWLFSVMDVHIISQHSGFGRMGAMISGKWNNVVQLFAGMGRFAGYEANLTYVARPGDERRAGRAFVDAGECANPSQSQGQAFCWPEDPPGPAPPMDKTSPMSLKVRHLCSKATSMEEVVKVHTGARRH